MRGSGLLKKLTAALLAVSCALLPVRAAVPARETEPPAMRCGSVAVLELNTGEFLFEKNGDERRFPASTTKILTALIALERCSLDETVVFSPEVIDCVADEARHFEISSGEEMSMRSVLKMMLVPSCNEGACAVAWHISGSEHDFANLMNSKAQALGMTNSHFVTCNGLQDSMHYVTAKDMARLIGACGENETFCELASVAHCTIEDAKHHDYEYTGFNELLIPESSNYRDYVRCSKTGHTWFAGFALMTCASMDGMDLAVAVLAGDSRAATFYDTTDICEYCFENWSVTDFSAEAEEAVGHALGEGTLTLPTHAWLLPKEDAGTTASVSVLTTERTEGRSFEGTLAVRATNGMVRIVPFFWQGR